MNIHVHIHAYPAYINTNAAACAPIHKSHNGMLFFTFCEFVVFSREFCDPINSVTKQTKTNRERTERL